MNKVGRPKKKGAKKAGELSDGLCRFSFIAEINTVAAIKEIAKGKGITIKELMKDALYKSVPADKNEITRQIKEFKVNQKLIKERTEKYLRLHG
jgi:hypothetical protein